MRHSLRRFCSASSSRVALLGVATLLATPVAPVLAVEASRDGGNSSAAPIADERGSAPATAAMDDATAGRQQSSGTPQLPQSTGSIESVRRARGAAETSPKPEAGSIDAKVPAIPSDARTIALLQRVRARWDAKLKHDYAAIYEFETPEFRADMNADAFARQFGGFAQWHGIDVIRVRYREADHAVVDMLLDATLTSPLDDTSFRTKTLLREHWVKSHDKWYHATRLETGPGEPDVSPSPEPASAPAATDSAAPEPAPQEPKVQ